MQIKNFCLANLIGPDSFRSTLVTDGVRRKRQLNQSEEAAIKKILPQPSLSNVDRGTMGFCTIPRKLMLALKFLNITVDENGTEVTNDSFKEGVLGSRPGPIVIDYEFDTTIGVMTKVISTCLNVGKVSNFISVAINSKLKAIYDELPTSEDKYLNNMIRVVVSHVISETVSRGKRSFIRPVFGPSTRDTASCLTYVVDDAGRAQMMVRDITSNELTITTEFDPELMYDAKSFCLLKRIKDDADISIGTVSMFDRTRFLEKARRQDEENKIHREEGDLIEIYQSQIARPLGIIPMEELSTADHISSCARLLKRWGVTLANNVLLEEDIKSGIAFIAEAEGGKKLKNEQTGSQNPSKLDKFKRGLEDATKLIS
jgi:hypothetical protein